MGFSDTQKKGTRAKPVTVISGRYGYGDTRKPAPRQPRQDTNGSERAAKFLNGLPTAQTAMPRRGQAIHVALDSIYPGQP